MTKRDRSGWQTLRICRAEECDEKALARGLCSSHYGAALKTDSLPVVVDGRCERADCERPGPFKSGLCRYHYRLFRHPGEAEVPVRKGRSDTGKIMRPELYEGQPPRLCGYCGEVKPATAFYASQARSGREAGKVRIRGYCRPCHGQHARDKLIAKWGTAGDQARYVRYRITAEERAELLAAQSGVCAICQDREPRVVDHDHTTGGVRGLLCNNCNTRLYLIESPVLRERALRYLGITYQPVA